MIIQATCEHLPLADNSVDLIFTDPPYPKKYLPCYEFLAQEAMRVLKPGGFVLAMAGGLFVNKIYRMFDDAGLTHFFRIGHKSTGDSPAIWMDSGTDFPYTVIARLKDILCYSKGPGRPRAGGMLNLFESSPGSYSKGWHHWGQDVESARYYIDYFSCPGQLIVDPFLGGGTTAVACELIGRRWVGCDIDPVALASSAARLSGAEIPYAMPLFEGAHNER